MQHSNICKNAVHEVIHEYNEFTVQHIGSKVNPSDLFTKEHKSAESVATPVGGVRPHMRGLSRRGLQPESLHSIEVWNLILLTIKLEHLVFFFNQLLSPQY